MSIIVNSVTENPINTQEKNKTLAFKSKPTPSDSVELSKKKKESSTGTKLGIGIGIAAIAGLCVELIWGKGKHLKSLWEKLCGKSTDGGKGVSEGKKYLDKIDDIKDNFSKIFGKDYTKDEANELALKYKEIFETQDNTEFMGKIFTQLQKDYKLPDIPYSIVEMPGNLNYAEWSLFGGGVKYNKNLLNCVIENNVARFTDIDRTHVVKALAHEMKHATQDKLANQVNIRKNIMAHIEREQRYNTECWQENLRKCGNNTEETKRKFVNALYDAMIPSLKTLERIPENSPQYQKGLEYIENTQSYIRPEDGLARYRNQLVEKEAFDAGDRMEQIYKWLMNR